MKTIIIAGSEGLIGRHVAKHLANSGFSVCLLDKTLGHDLEDERFVRNFFATQKGNILINLFAFNDHVKQGEKRGTLFDLSLESFRSCLEINLTALFSVCREFARNNESGRIINFGASTGIVSAKPDMYQGAHKHVGYSVSKAGVIHLTKILAAHLAPNFNVNCVSPGGVESDQSNEFKELYGSHLPLRRMLKLDEILPVIDMLIDERNTYMTGANIVIDGGWTII